MIAGALRLKLKTSVDECELCGLVVLVVGGIPFNMEVWSDTMVERVGG